jgi:hypothetical protein
MWGRCVRWRFWDKADYSNSMYFFLEDFGDSQKDQVRKSLDTAIGSENFEIKEWILCLSYSFDKKQTKWWFCEQL